MTTENLKTLSNSELHDQLKALTGVERKTLSQILHHIAEIDKRRYFSKLGYPSLFEYLTQSLGYSAGSAQRRIDGARLLNQIPELNTKIESGALNLTQISKVQKADRDTKKLFGASISLDEKKEILSKLENQSSDATDFILVQEFDLPVTHSERSHIQKDESTRIELTLNKAQMEILNRAKELLSHQLGGGTLAEVITELARKYVKSKMGSTPGRGEIPIKHENNLNGLSVALKPRNSTTTDGASGQVPIPLPLRKLVFQRDKTCRFKSTLNGKTCGSGFFLELDHIQPRFFGGENTAENLRILCSEHHKHIHRRNVDEI